MSEKIPVDLTHYLGSSDNPGSVITPIQLRGGNYDEWAQEIRRSLMAKRKFGFVDGTIKQPTDATKLEDWIAVQSMLVSWITNTLDAKLRPTIGDYDDASVSWTNLKNRFCVVEEIREEDYLHYFLIGLEEHYAPIRAQLLAQLPLPTVDVAYQNVVMTERLRAGGLNKENKESTVAFRVDAKTKSTFVDTSNLFCDHCNRQGHDKKGCFQLIGYPEWWGERGRGGRGRGRGGGRGSDGRGSRNSGSSGSASSGASKQNYVRANKVASGSSNGKQSSVSPEDASGLVGVNATQIQQILDILNPKSRQLHGKENSIPWIVDTGASNHVTCDFSVLINVKRVQTCPIGLTDGNSANADPLGTVILPGGLRFDNVLYVPQLTCNLIFVTQLSDESNCTMQFTNKICVIQDLQTRTVIGAGERVDGLYFFPWCSSSEGLSSG
ncbi:uncharacterized protein LOC110690200 [Chenopodium quinoa]|uniref:uncharacterized protein LOC110690200 n=1 Tax=Chenopodium quinoa TaxID=63459 RepID=UPI000B78E7DF|nr:uncharacterized protein LOC110690200 [Chenopodium quinoa]